MITLPKPSGIEYEFEWPLNEGPVLEDQLFDHGNVQLRQVKVSFYVEDGNVENFEVAMSGYVVTKAGARDKRRSTQVSVYNTEVRDSFLVQLLKRYDVRQALGIGA
jgi:hypothetical protein